ncbi:MULTISPECIES: cyclic nucleotide-binding domain-containing protein [Legionella]|uniref:DNA-binding transcriptional dual regulator Crp n=1 Tax=Legionella drozanskii LLAP-1 TaxID=1212489 RepID=A0A0W0SVR9_9GAMM|nr:MULTISPECIES: cyclic nucleotide-binding domain-containing protein [Legionella]KTC87487.1 DNA-binding transcriptional dual regulator Crp [Legionella drozanskii LLAP-1]PJE08199.1 MAG: hypothetical protein CK430_12735 [Legionella sp.]
MNDKDKINFYLVSVILLTSVAIGALLSSYSTALYISNFPRSSLPYYFIFSGVISVLVMWILIPILETTDKKPILLTQIISIILAALYLILSWWPSKILSLIYTFLFVGIIPIYAANSWDIAESAFDIRFFKRFTNKFLAINSIGSGCISIFSYFGIDIWGQGFLIYFSLFLMIVNCLAITKVKLEQTTTSKSRTDSLSLRIYPLFLILAGFIALLNLVVVFANYQMMFRLSEAFDMTQITKFMTVFYLVLNFGAFFSQYYAKRILEGFGISALFIFSTVIIFIFLLPTIVNSNLYSITLFNEIIWIAYAVFISLGSQVALNALPLGLKNKGQIFINAITVNLARIVASFILLFFVYRYAFYPYMILAILALSIMLILSCKIKKFYGETLLASIKGKSFYLPVLEEEHDYHFLKGQVNSLLKSEDPIKIKLGLSILRGSKDKGMDKNLLNLFDNPDPLIRIEAYKASSDFKKLYLAQLTQQLQKETDPEATWQLLYLIFQKSPHSIMEKLDEYLHSSNSAYQAIATIAAIKYGEFSQVRDAIETLEKMTNSKDEDEKFFAVIALSEVSVGNPVDLLEKLINDKNYKVAKQAIKATHNMQDRRIAHLLIKKLSQSNICHDAMQSLLKIKIDVAPLIFRSSLKINVHRYKPLIRVLCNLNSLTTEKSLSRLISKAPFLLSIELAKQIALRATKFELSEPFKKNILSHIDEIIAELNTFNFLLQQQTNADKKNELLFRRQLAEKKLIYYLVAVIKPEKIMEIYPKLEAKSLSQEKNTEYEIALEYIDWLIDDRNLAKKFFASIEDQLQVSNLSSSQLKLDCWTKKILDHESSEGKAMDTVDKVFALRKVPIYAHIPAELLMSIAEECQFVEFSKGEKLIKIGDYPDKIYMILSGSVAVIHNGKIERYEKENDVVGLFVLLSGRKSQLEVVVNESSAMLEISRTVFEQLTNDYPEILREIAKYVVGIYIDVVESLGPNESIS